MSRSRTSKTSPTTTRRVGVARVLSKLGIASRSVATAWVRAGRVALNGKTVHDPEQTVALDLDELSLDGAPVKPQQACYLMLNKPRGLVTTRHDERGRDTVYKCLPSASVNWLAPVGRLDKASEGLLLFTNDSVWASRLLDPANHVPKIYHVQINRRIDTGLLDCLRGDVTTPEGETLRAGDVQLLRLAEKTCWLSITLLEGRNRHIRRLCEALNLEVLRLVRVGLGPLALGTLAKGESRSLTVMELRALKNMLDHRGPHERS